MLLSSPKPVETEIESSPHPSSKFHFTDGFDSAFSSETSVRGADHEGLDSSDVLYPMLVTWSPPALPCQHLRSKPYAERRSDTLYMLSAQTGQNAKAERKLLGSERSSTT